SSIALKPYAVQETANNNASCKFYLSSSSYGLVYNDVKKGKRASQMMFTVRDYDRTPVGSWFLHYRYHFFTQRTKIKFMFAGPSKTTRTLFKSHLCWYRLTYAGTKHTIDFHVIETCTLVWRLEWLVGYDVTHGVEFLPADADGYIG
ncbi:hypothetical protein M8C21_015593, partial [Ambrosia artemisiifolia]